MELAGYYRVRNDDSALYQCDFYTDKSGGDLFCLREQWTITTGLTAVIPCAMKKFGDQTPVEISADLEMFGELAGEAQRSFLEDINWPEIYSDKPGTLTLAETEKAEGAAYCLEAHTDDGRFRSSVAELRIYRGRLYRFIGYDGRTELTYYYPRGEMVQDYFTELLGSLEGRR